MSDEILVEIEVPKTASVDKLKQVFREEIGKSEQKLTVISFEEVPTLGMTASDIVISLVISVGSSAAVHVYRNEIERAAKTAGELLKIGIRTFFKTKKEPIDEKEREV